MDVLHSEISFPEVESSTPKDKNRSTWRRVHPLLAVADPGFSWGGGRQLPKWYYFLNFLPKTAWKWKNLDPGGIPRAPPWIRQCLATSTKVQFMNWRMDTIQKRRNRDWSTNGLFAPISKPFSLHRRFRLLSIKEEEKFNCASCHHKLIQLFWNISLILWWQLSFP